MTDDERKLLAVLRRKNFADFFCPSAKLIVELDSGQHAEESHLRRDEERTRWLTARGYRVLRIWNADLKRRPQEVYEAIYAALTTPLPATFPLKGEGNIGFRATSRRGCQRCFHRWRQAPPCST